MKRIKGLSPVSALRTAWKNQSGAAIVEFALLTPILLGVVAGVADFSSVIQQERAMRAGVSSAAQYIMGGGTSLDAARQVGLIAWASHANNATVTTAKMCYCNSVVGDCTTLCPDQTLPKAYITIVATQPYDGWYVDTSLTAQQEVRIR